MRTISGGLATHLAGRSHTRSKMLRLDLRDGTSLGITDHDAALSFDLGDGALTYSAETGILPSATVLATGFDAGNVEVSGPIGDTVTRAAVLGGRFNRARCRYFEVNWASLGDGAIALLAGNVSDARVEGGRFILQIRSDTDRYNQDVGRLITPYCDADFGDARCGITVPTFDGTIASVTDGMRFVVTLAASHIDHFFDYGSVLFTGGVLAGTLPVEIVSWAATGAIELFEPLVALPAIGDAVTVRQGCSKVRLAANPNVHTCLTYANVINFRGFPEVPGSDQILKYPVP